MREGAKKLKIVKNAEKIKSKNKREYERRNKKVENI
jgi:hypothetical protein